MEQASLRSGQGTLAGHRLIRTIGADARAEVFLASGAVDTTAGRPVAVKVFRHGTDPAGIGREVHAMLAATPGMLARLDDVATTPDGRICLVLAHLPGLALDRLLTMRGRIGAAEVVTVAATAAASLQALHDVGLSHPAVRASCVRFDGRGRPVLLGLGAVTDLPAGVAGVAMRRDDVVGLTRFVQTLLEYLDPDDPAAASASALVAEFESVLVARPFPGRLAGLEGALFAWASAGPVHRAVPGAEPDAADEPAPARAAEVVSVSAAGPGRVATLGPAEMPLSAMRSAVSAAAPPVPGRTSALAAIDRWMRTRPLVRAAQIIRGQGARLGSVRHRGRDPRAGGRRRVRPLLLAAGVVVVVSAAGLGALSLLPGTSGGSSAATGQGRALPEPSPGGPGDGEQSSPAGAGPAGATPGAIEGDDPAAAVLELLRQREDCLADGSVLCLDGVNQQGSVAMAADGYRIRQAEMEGPAATDGTLPDGTATDRSVPDGPVPPLAARVQERTGNSALVVLEHGAGINAQPAAALVIKGEAGWRLRELFDY